MSERATDTNDTKIEWHSFPLGVKENSINNDTSSIHIQVNYSQSASGKYDITHNLSQQKQFDRGRKPTTGKRH